MISYQQKAKKGFLLKTLNLTPDPKEFPVPNSSY